MRIALWATSVAVLSRDMGPTTTTTSGRWCQETQRSSRGTRCSSTARQSSLWLTQHTLSWPLTSPSLPPSARSLGTTVTSSGKESTTEFVTLVSISAAAGRRFGWHMATLTKMSEKTSRPDSERFCSSLMFWWQTGNATLLPQSLTTPSTELCSTLTGRLLAVKHCPVHQNFYQK